MTSIDSERLRRESVVVDARLPGAFLGNRFPLTASVFTFRFGGDRFVLIRSQ